MKKFTLWLVTLLIWSFVIGIIVFYIWIFKEYGNKPVSEMPIWVYWVLNNGN